MSLAFHWLLVYLFGNYTTKNEISTPDRFMTVLYQDTTTNSCLLAS